MHAKNRNVRTGNLVAPLNPLAAGAVLPVTPGLPLPDNKLSAAFAAALGKAAGGADSVSASAGTEKRGGSGRPDQINKAPKPAAGTKPLPGHRSGHR